MKAYGYTAIAAVITGVMLIGTTGVTFVLGWALWASGLGALLTAVPTKGTAETRGARDTAPAHYSLVR